MSDSPDTGYTPPSALDRGRYSVEKVLGTGGTATVLLAHDTRMQVDRAIKVLHPQFARSRSTRARFMNEAHAQAQLKHPNVLMVHDVVEDDQGVYMVMELAENGALGSRIMEEGCLEARQVADIGIHVGEALSVAHAAGLVHRDIKPANILVDRHGVLKLADFGIARVRNLDMTLTRSGSVMGTWAFMPPEQREDSSQVDHRSDIYAFGVTLYALLTGRGTSRLHNREAWDQAYEGVPPGLATIIQRATRLYPEDRFATMAEMVGDLQAWRSSPEGSGPGWGALADPDEQATRPVPRFHRVAATAVPSDTAFGFDDTSGSDATHQAPPDAEPAPAADTWSDPPTGNPTTAPAPFPWLMLSGVAGGATVVAALIGIIVVLVFDRATREPPPPQVTDPTALEVVEAAPPVGSPPTGSADDPTPPVPEEPPSEVPPEASTPDSRPSKASPSASKTDTEPKRRVIKVIPTRTETPASADTPSTAPPDETGRLVVRTIPSGAKVLVGGRTPSRKQGAYVLPIGTHTVVLESGAGERHTVPVTIRSGRSVDICYSFDTNSACGGTP